MYRVSFWWNKVFQLRNYSLIVPPQKFDVLKTNILVLRTSNFQEAAIIFKDFLDESRDSQYVKFEKENRQKPAY